MLVKNSADFPSIEVEVSHEENWVELIVRSDVKDGCVVRIENWEDSVAALVWDGLWATPVIQHTFWLWDAARDRTADDPQS